MLHRLTLALGLMPLAAQAHVTGSASHDAGHGLTGLVAFGLIGAVLLWQIGGRA